MNKYSRSFNHPSQIRSGLKVWFKEVWNRTRVLNRKLGFYNKVKESFGPELYFSLKLGYFENKRVAQLRTSSHQYNIETGRHGQNKESVVNRICTTCSKNDDDTVTLLAEFPFFDPFVEDETHVIQTCPLYEDLRKKLKAPTSRRPRKYETSPGFSGRNMKDAFLKNLHSKKTDLHKLTLFCRP